MLASFGGITKNLGNARDWLLNCQILEKFSLLAIMSSMVSKSLTPSELRAAQE